ncbi:DUF2079 domain-containing protein [Actinospica durhamensis]|uniref:DUF2079 domain-containing protein n=1 Tax=Actinospica durhamensis TaxID=1508375 RepID=A0A941EVH7_9ACTN|nr:DUF2079 domain-containing protein [Actinospica durhamensis]MBR7837142.1 DUF2079 domain-containing protein [Actinospica durhamensis]
MLPWLLAAICLADYAALGLADQARMLTSGFDLGIFDQAVRAYAHGQAPVTPLKGFGFDLLGDHFSPIIALLAPFYWIWPSADMLLLAQAVLFALAAVPLTRWAMREVGTWPAVIIGACYGASWGIAAAAGFDFHEVAFGVPLVAFSVTALGERRLTAAALWALPLLLVKEDMGLTTAVIGIMIAARGRRVLGLATVVAGVAGSLLEITVLIPMVSHRGYTYMSNVLPGASSASSAWGLGGLRTDALVLIHAAASLSNPVKLDTLVMLLAPTAFVALRSPLIWLAVPTLAWRFASDNPSYWGTGYQYSAVLMPIVAAAFIDGLARWRRSGRRASLIRSRIALGVALAVTALLLPSRPTFSVLYPGNWSRSPHVAAADRLLDMIPDEATVAATNRLAPQLTDRDTVTLLGTQLNLLRQNSWIIADTQGPPFPGTAAQLNQWLTMAQHQDGFHVVAEEDGILLLKRSI